LTGNDRVSLMAHRLSHWSPFSLFFFFYIRSQSFGFILSFCLFRLCVCVCVRETGSPRFLFWPAPHPFEIG
jgi:hypothetical protein